MRLTRDGRTNTILLGYIMMGPQSRAGTCQAVTRSRKEGKGGQFLQISPARSRTMRKTMASLQPQLSGSIHTGASSGPAVSLNAACSTAYR